MKTLYLECNMGAAGDMIMSALYEVCDKREDFLTKMNELFGAYDITLSPKSVTKCGICGTHMDVTIGGTTEVAGDVVPEQIHTHEHIHSDEHAHAHDEHSHDGEHTHDIEHAHDGEHSHTHDKHSHDGEHSHADEHTHSGEHVHDGGHAHVHASYASILSQIDAFDLPARVKSDAKAIYRLIGEAEAKVHGTTIEQIHFHEVGTLDAVADVVGCALLLHLIDPDQILASPIHVGNGFVKCAHGVLPVPAPATAEILKGVPYYTGSVASELCTPTGAAILKYYVSKFSVMPALTPSAIGYGMGYKDFDIANCLRVFLGETADSASEEPEYEDSFDYDDRILSISCNIDDMTGEAIGLATEIFLAAGVLDVFTTPIQMKKNRPGVLLTCICDLEDRDKFTGLFFLHTSTRGVRYQVFDRAKLDSTFETRSTAFGDIRIKKSAGYGIEKEKPEFEDLKTVVLKNECSMSLADVAKSIR